MRKLFDFYNDIVNWFMRFTSNGYRYELVYEKQVELFYRQLPHVLLAVILVSTITATIFFHKAPILPNMLWLSSIYLLTILRFYYFLQWKNQPEKRTVHQWAEMGVHLSFISGIQWGLTAFIFFNPDSVIDAAILIVILLGMISGAVASLSVIPAAFTLYTAPMTIFLVTAIFQSGNPDYYPLGYLLVVFILAASFLCRNSYKSNMYGIRLSIENQDLIKNLQTEKEKAEAANIAKSKFLASASHDLRQPLQSMTLFTEALRENLTEQENIELAERITSSHNALRELLNALLDISKLDAGGIEVQNTVFDIADILSDLAKEFQPLASQKQQQLQVTDTSHMVYSDPVLCKRIIQNLLANAVHYSPPESVIEVKSRVKDEKIMISVNDNGPGIPLADQEHVFNEFYQLQNPERDRKKGLGLGLAIVKRLSLLLDSQIRLESDEGKGCHFFFELPLANQQQSTQIRKHADNPGPFSLKGIHVLLVEDEVDVREALGMLLQRWGCHVMPTDNISEAVNIVDNNNIDLIITDYRLREHETGIMMLSRIHQEHPIPAILITGDTAAEQIQEFLQAGHTVLHKPVKPAELRMAIQQLYSRAAKAVSNNA